MQTPADIKALLASVGASPKYALGQNFLIAHDHITRLVDRAGVGQGDLVLEVGPGTGAMTDLLAQRGCELVLSELDEHMVAILRARFAERVTIVEGDCLASKRELSPALLDALGERPFTLVANLPYGAASPLMVALAADHADRCRGQYVTIQREVGQRLRAQPGTRDYSELSIVVQAMCTVERVATLPPGCFWPQPKVTSEMVAIEPRPEPLTDDPRALASMCRRLFTKRRKQLGTILGRDAPLPPGVTADLRPEALTVEQLVALTRLAG
ncbi:MAG: 16S rRNA (adenine(1518)-N(6)/adenine(1519)-N(6)) -dimethyltransferase RsmA [Phycisphaerales bacterium]